jgi:hypothetical protein
MLAELGVGRGRVMLKIMRCWLGWHIWTPYRMYVPTRCVYCGKIEKR